MCLQMCENSKVSAGGLQEYLVHTFQKKLDKPLTRIGFEKIKERLL